MKISTFRRIITETDLFVYIYLLLFILFKKVNVIIKQFFNSNYDFVVIL